MSEFKLKQHLKSNNKIKISLNNIHPLTWYKNYSGSKYSIAKPLILINFATDVFGSEL